MTGSELIACSKALKEFEDKNPKIDLSYYEVLIKHRPGSFEVVFVPNQVPVTELESYGDSALN